MIKLFQISIFLLSSVLNALIPLGVIMLTILEELIFFIYLIKSLSYVFNVKYVGLLMLFLSLLWFPILLYLIMTSFLFLILIWLIFLILMKLTYVFLFLNINLLIILISNPFVCLIVGFFL